MTRLHVLPLLAAGSLLHAGDGKTAAPVTPTPPANPLAFYNGELVFDFQSKGRFEYRENNFDFNDQTNALTDDSWMLYRTRLGVKWKPTSWFNIYVQGQDVREFDSDRPNVIGQMGAEGDDTFDLRIGYMEIGDPLKGLSFKLGRQALLYGDQRLIGPLEWLNTSRVFDAAKLHYAGTDWFVDAFVSSVVRFQDDTFNLSDLTSDEDTRNQLFSGVYFSSTGLLQKHTTDFYALHLSEEYAVGDTNFVTLGTRIKADPLKNGGWDYETEMVGQFGKKQGQDLASFAGHWGFGKIWTTHSWKPRLFAEYNFGSGDDNPTDGEINTFQNLFPTNHLFYGYMDLFSWQNIHNPAISFSVNPTKQLMLKADFHAFMLATTNDFWYRVNGVTTARPKAPGSSKFAGTELDLTATYKYNDHLKFMLGYSHFFAGDTLKATGSADDADFAYVEFQIDF
jgi:hypothetical protein